MKWGYVAPYFVSGFIALSVPTCAVSAEKDLSEEKLAAAIIAEKYVADRYADFDQRNKKLLVKDDGANWEVTYELPDDMIGGAPVIVIDKKTKRVIRSYRTQ